MPREDHHMAKDVARPGRHPLTRQLTSWTSRFLVPALANRAARAEIAGRKWLEETAPRRRWLASRVAAQPLTALLAVAGLAYLAGAVKRSRR